MILRALAVLCLLSVPVNAQSACAPFAEWEKHLREKYQEQRSIQVLANDNSLFVFFERTDGNRSWTMIVGKPDTNRFCIGAAGSGGVQRLELKPVEKKGADS
jgi:hypothetical protein